MIIAFARASLCASTLIILDLSETVDTVESQVDTIRRFVDVRPRPVVVRLEHLDDERNDWITSDYHVTSDIENHLRALRHVLARECGTGIFLIGQYGAGKSHFLAYIARAIASGELGPTSSASSSHPNRSTPPEVVPLSLLNFRAATPLEDIVGGLLGIDVGDQDRRGAWAAALGERPAGVFLLIDELSEFLRSKPDRASFTEDIRFLQFMGEWAQEQPFWILAAMQEEIEHTGQLEYSLYRKIKDRYPLRFLLTPKHVKELISDCILHKKRGYEQRVAKLAADLRQAFPESPFDADDICALYPIHPATFQVLEEIRDRFSQNRGVVDFTLTQLGGDPARHLDPFLDLPWGTLLTPDSVIDHFQDVLELQPEFQPLAQQLFPYYRKRLSTLFKSEKSQTLAMRLLKLLVIAHLSPTRDGLTAQEAAYWLLFKATRLDPARNLQIVERILRQLLDEGCYVVRRNSRFCLDLEDDGGPALEKFLSRQHEEIRNQGLSVFESLISLLQEEDFNPFTLPREDWQPRMLNWHFHEREYGVYFGNEAPTPHKTIGLCVRLPWGDAMAAEGCYTLRPRQLELGEEIVELAALMRARERSWTKTAHERIEARLRERLTLFRGQLVQAYRDVRLTHPTGIEERAPPRLEPVNQLNRWLGGYAQWAFRHAYPSFERFAPSHGPLPREALRSWMRFAAESDIGAADADPHVQVIREGYLVPMKLLKRDGRRYVVPGNLDKHELVSLLRSVLEFRPEPKVAYEHMSAPVYGLVPDQVSALMIFLLTLGEVDIVKGRQSYRDLFETLPNPVQYDRVLPGAALSMERLRELQQLCEGFQIRIPGEWTVLSQRRTVGRLREAGGKVIDPLRQLLTKLEGCDEAPLLQERVRSVLRQWSVLEESDDEIMGLERFLVEVGAPGAFLRAVGELKDLPERIERLVGDLQRYTHLLEESARLKGAPPELEIRREALASPPELDRPEAVDQWLKDARELYEEYKEEYRRRHDAWWEKQQTHASLTWKVPELARSRHLDLGDVIQTIKEVRESIERSRCRGLVNLDFQPRCSCGFDGERAPVAADLERFVKLSARIESAVAQFFQREEVKSRVRRWIEEGLGANQPTLAYVQGDISLPQIDDIEQFDRYLAGVELVKEVSGKLVLDLLCERTWEKDSLLDALRSLLDREGDRRLRFSAPDVGTPEIARWCLEQSLCHAVPLPGALRGATFENIEEAALTEWTGEPALRCLEKLGLDESLLRRILIAVLERRVVVPATGQLSPLVEAARELLAPTVPQTGAELASLAATLYLAHDGMMKTAKAGGKGGWKERWLERLSALAATPCPPGTPALVEVLSEPGDRASATRYLVIDGLGVPLLGVMRAHWEDLLPGWREEHASFAKVGEETTTDAFYRQLADSGFTSRIEKVNAVDTLLHERFVPLEDLCGLVLAELRLALKAVLPRLDAGGHRLLVFADHGFRLAPDGCSYVHGGDSTLERLVPVITLVRGGG